MIEHWSGHGSNDQLIDQDWPPLVFQYLYPTISRLRQHTHTCTRRHTHTLSISTIGHNTMEQPIGNSSPLRTPWIHHDSDGHSTSILLSVSLQGRGDEKMDFKWSARCLSFGPLSSEKVRYCENRIGYSHRSSLCHT